MKKIKLLQRICMVSAFVLVVASCKDDFTAPASPTGTTLAASIAADNNFNILTASLKLTNLYNSFDSNNSGQFTVFGPSDAAFVTYYSATYPAYFAAIAPNTEAQVLTFLGQLSATSAPTLAAYITTTAPIINYHTISSQLTGALITGNQVFTTLQGARLSISKSGGGAITTNGNSAVNGANVTTPDAATASNGVLHTIDHVMAAVASANILTPFGLSVNYTVNPPTVGGGTTTDGSGANFNLMSAMIRITGQAPVLLPNTSPLPDFTVFTPTDAAMIAYLTSVNAGLTTEALCYTFLNTQLNAASTPNLADITDIVKYHILPAIPTAVPPLPGRYLATDFTNGQVLTTQLTGKSITVAITGVDPAFTYTLGDLNAAVDPVITTKNVFTNSGIQHIINGVLLPK